jgi:F-type H+-transporting ATPase subunit b
MSGGLAYLGEVIAFVVMVLVIARFWPRLMALAEDRQRALAEQLTAAERTRQEAEERLAEIERRVAQAGDRAEEIIAGARRTSEQLQADLRERAEEDVRRIKEAARIEIETERRQAVESVRSEIGGLVVAATERVVGEALDAPLHGRLIDDGIARVSSSNGHR